MQFWVPERPYPPDAFKNKSFRFPSKLFRLKCLDIGPQRFCNLINSVGGVCTKKDVLAWELHESVVITNKRNKIAIKRLWLLAWKFMVIQNKDKYKERMLRYCLPVGMKILEDKRIVEEKQSEDDAD